MNFYKNQFILLTSSTKCNVLASLVYLDFNVNTISESKYKSLAVASMMLLLLSWLLGPGLVATPHRAGAATVDPTVRHEQGRSL